MTNPDPDEDIFEGVADALRHLAAAATAFGNVLTAARKARARRELR